MRVAGIVRDSIVNGEGIRDVIFVQGCSHHCKNCQNKHTWDYNGGTEMSTAELLEYLADSSNDITISGGEPLDQYNPLLRFLKQLRSTTSKRVWLYTGNTLKTPFQRIYRLLSQYVDVIVDGKFVEELKDPDLLFRGSSNQRLIDLPKSVELGEIVEWTPKEVEV